MSTRTVVQVLRHWIEEGVTYDQLHAAIDCARGSVAKGSGQDHEQRLARYERAIRAGLVVPAACSHKS